MSRVDKKKKRKISVFKILALLLLLMSIFISYIIYKINILPNKYYLVLLGTLIFINLLFLPNINLLTVAI